MEKRKSKISHFDESTLYEFNEASKKGQKHSAKRNEFDSKRPKIKEELHVEKYPENYYGARRHNFSRYDESYYNKNMSTEDESYPQHGYEYQHKQAAREENVFHSRNQSYFNKNISTKDESYSQQGYEYQFHKQAIREENIGFHSKNQSYFNPNTAQEVRSTVDYRYPSGFAKLQYKRNDSVEQHDRNSKQMFMPRRKDFLIENRSFHNKGFNVEDEDYNGSLDICDPNPKDNGHLQHKIFWDQKNYHTSSNTEPLNEYPYMQERMSDMSSRSYERRGTSNQVFEKIEDHSDRRIVTPNLSNFPLTKNCSQEMHTYYNEQENKNLKLRKRKVVAQNDDSISPHDRKRKGLGSKTRKDKTANLKPLTINDAISVAKCMHVQPKMELFTIEQENANNILSGEEVLTLEGRQCWSKLCVSTLKHSHVVLPQLHRSLESK